MVAIDFISNGTITSPKGFSAGSTYAGIKKPGDNVRDLAILLSQEPCNIAGVFTKNKIKSAAVVSSQKRLVKGGLVSALVVNSGCANSSTGEQGLEDAEQMAVMAAKSLGTEPGEVMVSSTGVIGVLLPMDKIKDGINKVILTPDGGHEFVRGIMTTDTVPKEVAVTVKNDGIEFTVGGVAKGSGMIHPNMGTMLSFVTTDAAVSPGFLKQVLHEVVEDSFNMVTVDGDTSPSDTLLVLANGMAGNPPISENSPEAGVFKEALKRVCVYLAREIARDGEGATKLIEVTVKNAASTDEARRAARTIAGSNLVKSAVYGNDPNWGRVTAALGRAEVKVDESRLDVWMAGVMTLKNGAPVPFDREKAVQALRVKEVPIVVDMKLGNASAVAWGCDLTENYVKINAEYTT